MPALGGNTAPDSKEQLEHTVTQHKLLYSKQEHKESLNIISWFSSNIWLLNLVITTLMCLLTSQKNKTIKRTYFILVVNLIVLPALWLWNSR
jgi:Ca2+/Na+ antiporter